MLPDDIVFAPITTLSVLLRDRQLSPVELADAYLERLERFGPKLNAVVTITREVALAEARAAEQEIARGLYRGPLHGIPYGAKDLLATSGIPTTWGAPPYRSRIFDFDATVVTRLREAGAVLVGKLAMLELAGVGHYRFASASLTGPGLNPWDPGTYTGGSSSGSGSATAAGLVGFAIGSETWGSILTPASFCGITGLRPTHGLVSRHGAMSLAWSMDKLGPMCRSVEDCAIVLQAIAGADPNDNATLADGFVCGPWRERLDGLRLGVVQEHFENHGEPEVEQGFKQALDVLTSLGAKCDVVNLPDFPHDEMAEVIVASEAADAFEDLIASGRIHELVDRSQTAGILAGMEIKAVDYLKAMRMRTVLRNEFNKVWDKCEAIVAPTSLLVSPSIQSETTDLYLTPTIAAGNLLGLPAITVPCGFGKNSLPIALSVAGQPLAESTILQIAQAYQKSTDWHTRRPPLFSTPTG